jgi:[CysO sulfur-carrier protein]-S-L-cysteine hydrolase
MEQAPGRPRWPLVIPEDVYDAMIAHSVRDSPLECCGLLAGFPPFVSSIHPLRNALASETRYDADPRDLIEAHLAFRARNADLLAIYHSHPRSSAMPSRTDLELNFHGDVPRIIISLLGKVPEMRIWRLDESSYEELEWRITPRSC